MKRIKLISAPCSIMAPVLAVSFLLASACREQTVVTETPSGKYLYNHIQMPMDTANSLRYKWEHKKILDSVLIDDMESLDNWAISFGDRENVASISLSGEKVFEGSSSIKFVSPTKLKGEPPFGERYWGRQNLTRRFNSEDFSKYNRISLQVYPQFRGFNKVYLTLILHNSDNVPDRYGKEGWHTVMLKNNRWNRIVMEIPHLPHDKVNGITISYGLQGNEPGAADTIIYYTDRLMLESVEPDRYEGWDTGDEISFSHSGYNLSDRKCAFSSAGGPGKFTVVDNSTKKTVFEGDVTQQTGNTGTFSVFDFSDLRLAGEFRIMYGALESKPFMISEDVWLPVLEKLTNYFYVNRCGFELPGIHQVCHKDWYAVDNGDTVVMAGGWHDAGDVSQSYWQTASATAAFFRLAKLYEKRNPVLSARLAEEGTWGLEWIHRNHFDSLKIASWTTIDRYTDGIIGNYDDPVSRLSARTNSNDIYHAIIAEVEASVTLRMSNPLLATRAEEYAVDYWDRLAAFPTRWNTERLSLAVLAGAKLYGLTGRQDVKIRTLSLADSLMEYQETMQMKWEIPLTGFFYSDRRRERLLSYNHSSPISSPVTGLSELCRLFPGDAGYDRWLKSIKLYTGYIRTAADFTAPYYMIPAGVYSLTGGPEDTQVNRGLKLDEKHYLKMFPVWGEFRGNSSVILSPAVGIASANQILNDPDLRNIALSQLEWMVGKNPFCQSLMYGEGYEFTPQYAVFTDDVVGGLPVGILTREDLDIPYWKTSVLHNYKELWGQPAFRMMELISYLNF